MAVVVGVNVPVEVGVLVGVEVRVGVFVGVRVGVFVGVEVAVAVAVRVGVSLGVVMPVSAINGCGVEWTENGLKIRNTVCLHFWVVWNREPSLFAQKTR